MGFLAPALPFLQQAGMAGAGMAGSMGVQKAGQAIFGGDAQSANMAPPPGGPGGMNAGQSPAMSILAGLQQQMQDEERKRQEAMMMILSQAMAFMPQMGQRQMTGSVGQPTVVPGSGPGF